MFTKSINILIVEDNLFMAQLLAEKMRRQGYKAEVASDGQEALDKAEVIKFNLVLLDLPLDGPIDGFEILKKLRKKADKKTLPIITLFNLDEPHIMEQSLELGANDYLVKAFTNTEAIVEKIKDLLENKVSKKTVSQEDAEAVMLGKEVPKVPIKSTVHAPNIRAEMTFEAPKTLKAKIEQTVKMPESEVPIINLVDDLMEYAYLARASDIHFEPCDDSFLIRLRVDGLLHDVFSFPKGLQSGIITRIKVLSGMRTDEHQAAQDGRFKTMIKNPSREFDVRISIIPTYYGENAVLRLLAEQTQLKRLDDLALTEADKIKIRHATSKPYGMILATGPTGSGKTTTLYTILKELNTREVSVITIEDPVEYSLEGVDQIQVSARTGLTFATGLRAILRQDPNIIMVGEIRDEETASIAVNAALTGHKLLSTLHTNDAATTLPRLFDMGIEPFLVASTVNIAIGQRLVRLICEKCKAPKKITDAEFQSLSEHVPPEILGKNRDFFYGKGCDECGGSGYFERAGLYEVLEVNDFVREAILRRADAGEIKKIAIKNGMTTLLVDGFKKALAGMTTIEEILRVIRE
jgi:type II secretory ATPase GspE/PulE/Tfp pilus assembly ATPase PilB-like protein